MFVADADVVAFRVRYSGTQDGPAWFGFSVFGVKGGQVAYTSLPCWPCCWWPGFVHALRTSKYETFAAPERGARTERGERPMVAA